MWHLNEEAKAAQVQSYIWQTIGRASPSGAAVDLWSMLCRVTPQRGSTVTGLPISVYRLGYGRFPVFSYSSH